MGNIGSHMDITSGSSELQAAMTDAGPVLRSCKKKKAMSRSFTFFSGLLLHSALHFARSAQEMEQKAPKLEAESRSCVLGAITLSVAFLEALINEVFIVAREDVWPYDRLDAASRQSMANLQDEVASKLGITAKYDLVLTLNGREGFDHGVAPYQDVDALVQLRNAVVHYRLGFRPHPDPDPLKIESRLRGKFPVSAYYIKHKGAFFPHRCLGAGCAAWAVNSARAYADDFHRKIGVVSLYQQQAGLPTLL
jgi:hypothetical protein